MNEWISTKDRLPEKTGKYRLRDKDGNEFDGEFDGKSFGCWHQYFNPATFGCFGEQWESFDNVTHWKLLPEPETSEEPQKDAHSLIAEGYAYTERFPFDGQPPAVLDVLKGAKNETNPV